MPKAKSVPENEIVECLRKHKHLFYNNDTRKIEGPSKPCWEIIANDLQHKITAKHVYTIVLSNRYNVRKLLSIDSEDRSPLQDNSSPPDSPDNDSSEEKFQITLQPNEWESILQPVPQIYKRKDGNVPNREYQILRPYNWSGALHARVHAETRVPCNISYKRAKIYETGNHFLDIIGKCNSCESKLKIVSQKPLSSTSPIILECTYTGDFKSCSATRKRRILGDKKIEFADKLTNQQWSASYTQKVEANKVMEYGEREPSHVPSANALRILKFKTQAEEQIHKDPILSLCFLKKEIPYNSIIKDIGYDRFFVHYWSSQEINTYRLYSKGNEIPRITIDATGSVVKPVILLDGRKTHHIFLYEIGIMDYHNKVQFAAGHMLSERHDANSISYWLTEWAKSDIVGPKLVVTDHSLALMIASVKSFTQFTTLAKYLHACSSLLLDESNADIPNCMLRNDFNHIMKLFSGWPEIKSGARRFKEFYLRSIALIISCESYTEIKTLFRHVFTVAMNEEDGLDETGEPTPCEQSKINLKRRIAFHQATDEVLDLEHNLDHDDPDDPSPEDSPECQNVGSNQASYTTPMFQEIENIYTKCHEECNTISGEHDNLHYCPEIAKRLLKFSKFLPCWSAIMNPIFGYGKKTESSATSESLFNELKHQIFHHRTLPIRVDDFLKIHCNFILGNTKLLRNKYRNDDSNQSDDPDDPKSIDVAGNENLDKSEDPDDCEIVNEVHNNDESSSKASDDKKKTEINDVLNVEKEEVENWRGKGKPPPAKKTKKTNYLEKDPTILHYNDHSKAKAGVVGILKNGTCMPLKSIRIDDRRYTFQNTCTFDSLVQILCTAFADSTQYASFITSNNSFLLFELISHMLRDGVTSQTYAKRGRILAEIFDREAKEEMAYMNLRHVSCNCTAYDLLRDLLGSFPSFTETEICSFCNHTATKNNVSIVLNFPSADIQFFSNLLQDITSDKSSICEACGKETTKKTTARDHVFIEPWIVSKNPNEYGRGATFTLSQIPQQLSIANKTLNLRGIMSFIGSRVSHKGIGHYISYCWREHSKKWERYDDLEEKFSNVRSRSDVSCEFFVYTI